MVKVKVSYPDELRERVLKDLKASEKDANRINRRWRDSRTLNKLLKVTKMFPAGMRMRIQVEELDKNSCMIQLDFTGSMLVGERAMIKMIRKQAKSYKDPRVTVEEIKEEEK
jgi:hypothetical protein